MAKLKHFASILITVAVLSLTIEVFNVHADVGNSEFYLAPAGNNFTTSTTPVDTKFNITCMWKDTGTPLNEVFAWQVTFYYNTTLLNCTHAWQPVWDPDYIFSGMQTVRPNPSLLEGTVQIMDSLYSGSGKGASKKLVVFEMQIMTAPPQGGVVSSALNINNPDSFWSPDGANWIAPTLTDGTYQYSSEWTPPPPATIAVDPSSISDRSLGPGSNVSVNIRISGATNVYQFDLKLGFDKAILNGVEAKLGGFFPQSVVPSVTIDNATGFVRVSGSLMPPETAKSGSGTLTTINFTVVGVGSCSLHLYDILLKDDSGHTLPATTNDGSFNNGALIGDITGPNGVPDGKIDVRDVALVGSCLGSRPEYPKWDKRCDINGDGKINILDVAFVAKNFGQHT